MSDASGVKQKKDDWAGLMGVKAGQLVQELGWDEDSDSSISESLEDAIGEALLTEEDQDLVDMVLFWWRADDGDLVDGLVDATRNLGEDGKIWLLTPANGYPGTVAPSDIAESAQLAGLIHTSGHRLGQWQGACLMASGNRK